MMSPVHSSPIRVFRVSTNDASDRDILVPFGKPRGHIIAPPLYDQDRRILVAFDSVNRGIGGWRYDGSAGFAPLWQCDWRSSNQLTFYADTGELVHARLRADFYTSTSLGRIARVSVA